MRRPEDDPYEILGLEQGATWEEIKEAYRRELRKYHPDHNPGDQASGWITKRIIEAYEYLHGTHGHAGERMPPERDPSEENDRGHRDRQAGEQQERVRTQLAQDDTRAMRGVTSERRTPWGLLVPALGGLILVTLLASEGTRDRPDEAIPDSTLSDWRARLRADLDAGVFESTPQTITEERTEAAATQPPNTNTVDAVSSTANRVFTPTNTTPPRPLASSEFFSRGSHEDDVLRIQGTPTEIHRYAALGYEDWYYGLNEVTISTATRRVTEWTNSNGALKVRLPPGANVTGSEFFSRGSHEDDVLRIQGTPTEIHRYAALGYEDWYYGLNEVTISTATRRVTQWSNSSGTLKVRLPPGANVTGSEFFSRDSHEDDVLRIQGTPTEIRRYAALGYELWYYGLNEVTISTATRRVTGWSNSSGTLKVRMSPGGNKDSSNEASATLGRSS